MLYSVEYSWRDSRIHPQEFMCAFDLSYLDYLGGVRKNLFKSSCPQQGAFAGLPADHNLYDAVEYLLNKVGCFSSRSDVEDFLDLVAGRADVCEQQDFLVLRDELADLGLVRAVPHICSRLLLACKRIAFARLHPWII